MNENKPLEEEFCCEKCGSLLKKQEDECKNCIPKEVDESSWRGHHFSCECPNCLAEPNNMKLNQNENKKHI